MLGTVIAEALQLIGILAFAISGALIGVRRRLDLLGVLVVGGATGTGGGIIRDLLIGVNPPVTLTYWPNIAVALAGSLLVFFLHPRISRIRHFEIVFDAFGLGLFSVTGTVSALEMGHGVETSIIVGVITAIGGGVTRDVLVNTIPGVLTSELYAVSALVGATVTATVAFIIWTVDSRLDSAGVIASIIGGAAAITLRLLSYWKGWHLPRPKFSDADDSFDHDE